jgi:hypothetical protein
MAKTPSTPPPTDLEWENHRKWAVGPVGTRRQLWIEKEAQAIHYERTGKSDPWPSSADYAEAVLRVSKADR